MKTKSKLGKTDSIFTDTTSKKAGVSSSGLIVKPQAATSSSIENKITVIMPPDQVAFLDRLCLDIRMKTKAKIRRTEIIRALVAGVQMSRVDLSIYETEDAIAAAIGKQLMI